MTGLQRGRGTTRKLISSNIGIIENLSDFDISADLANIFLTINNLLMFANGDRSLCPII